MRQNPKIEHLQRPSLIPIAVTYSLKTPPFTLKKSPGLDNKWKPLEPGSSTSLWPPLFRVWFATLQSQQPRVFRTLRLAEHGRELIHTTEVTGD